ncbi:small integral membrane protein 40 [Spea bombifrons]|uniref:small integral membrane protein 40 n=1 Tax=Spea bombifrons TaxID=233779 RepID=UPI00234B987F|nr:small integral membrane protein 40 [Spea bombifrons]
MDSSSSDNEESSSPLLTQQHPPDEEDFDEEDTFAVLARATPAPDSVPWQQRSTKMKIVYVADRIFLTCLAVFLLVLAGEVAYVVYHAVPWVAMARWLMDWLLMQEEMEEELDL